MTRPVVLAAAAVMVATFGTAVPAAAAPAPDTPCVADIDGALTRTTGDTWECLDGVWRLSTDPYASSDRWLSWGDEPLVVHGQGRRNPEVRAGTWTGTPQTPEAQCLAEVVDVAAPGQLTAPEPHAADVGEPVAFTAGPAMFSVTLDGYCLWERTP
jgi:hypothetical protein